MTRKRPMKSGEVATSEGQNDIRECSIRCFGSAPALGRSFWSPRRRVDQRNGFTPVRDLFATQSGEKAEDLLAKRSSMPKILLTLS